MWSLRLNKKIGVLAFLLSMAVVLASVLFLPSCSSADSSTNTSQIKSNQTETDSLKVAVQYNALSIPTVYADEKGYFDEEGLNIDLFTYVNGAEENKAMESGEVEIASDGLASVYMLATGDFNWIGESDPGSATVVVYIKKGSPASKITGQVEDNPNVKGSADTLRGLTVAGPAGTMEEWVATSYFSQFGLAPGVDYEFIEMERPTAVDKALKGETDIFVATDVDYSRLMEKNGFIALAKGSEATKVHFNNGYLVSNNTVENRYDDLVAFIKAVYKAAEYLDNNPKDLEEFAYEYYASNGKPATMEDVREEIKVRKYLVPSDFTNPDYRLGSGVLDVGEFNSEIGALDAEQVGAIQKSLNPKVLEDAFDITVQTATLD